jgi:hypothetical protein
MGQGSSLSVLAQMCFGAFLVWMIRCADICFNFGICIFFFFFFDVLLYFVFYYYYYYYYIYILN